MNLVNGKSSFARHANLFPRVIKFVMTVRRTGRKYGIPDRFCRINSYDP